MPTHVYLYSAFAVLLPVSVIPPCFTIIAPYSLGLNLRASSLTSTWFAKGQAKLASSSCPNDHNPPSVSLYMRASKGMKLHERSQVLLGNNHTEEAKSKIPAAKQGQLRVNSHTTESRAIMAAVNAKQGHSSFGESAVLITQRWMLSKVKPSFSDTPLLKESTLKDSLP
ncbi:30303_t:CDS:2 [Racocetra persica]|uniref:30303_t:CDS:1 n=1 Tax=Racocetra persica TaxID=160502 RepID=A0ACA9KM94_9GLOM|nr:30303_t:CDS:2 [Racocetra persica]